MPEDHEREEYEAPAVQSQSVEEMLTEAQGAVDRVFDLWNRADARVEDLTAALASIHESLEELETALTEAEMKVQKITYVASHLKGEEHVDPDRTG